MSTLTVTIIQSDLHWEDKGANLAMFREKIFAIKEKTELVVLPEMFSTGFSMNPERLAETMDGETIAWMKQVATQKNIILTGSVIIKDKGQYFNRLIWMLPNGQMGVYDKRHRFAYAGEDEHYTAGNSRLIASVKGWKINLMICYDLRFPVWSRQQVQSGEPEYDVLVYVANWPEKRVQAWQKLLQARAIENQCFVIGVNRTGVDGNDHSYTGDSMVVNPYGEPLNPKTEGESIFTVTLQKAELEAIRTKLPFWKDGDHFMISP
ncbi:MAG: amidohydrolase [Terrimonas sp.]|nr:amidohydrolase [Terrimonas sp.]